MSASVQLHCSKASVYTFTDGRNDSVITPSDVTFVQVVLLQHKTRRSETCTMLLCTTPKVNSKNSEHEAEFYSHESFLSMNLEKRNAYLHNEVGSPAGASVSDRANVSLFQRHSALLKSFFIMFDLKEPK